MLRGLDCETPEETVFPARKAQTALEMLLLASSILRLTHCPVDFVQRQANKYANSLTRSRCFISLDLIIISTRANVVSLFFLPFLLFY